MTLDRTAWLVAGALAIGSSGVAAGYWLHSKTMHNDAESAAPVVAQPAAPRTPLYYQDPDGKPKYSPAPKKTADGRDYKPVYDDAPAQPAASTAGSKRILYYRNPMGLADTSPVPKK